MCPAMFTIMGWLHCTREEKALPTRKMAVLSKVSGSMQTIV